MVTQWLFGETAEVQERQAKWSRLCFDHDGYEGWVDNKQILPCDTPNLDPDLRVIDNGSIVDLGDRQVMLPYGAVLPYFKDGSILFQGRRVPVNAVTNTLEAGEREALVMTYIRPFLGAPYLWGGRTPWGVDCSGFTQAIFIFMGIYLPRDARQQATEGDPVPAWDQATPGDLAFFANPEGRVVHTGIVLSDQRIVHASGAVRMDRLTAEGIYNQQERMLSHHLHSIRRIV
jgi:hypothetical protein